MTEQQPFPPVFATNSTDGKQLVFEEINRMLAGLRESLAKTPDLAIATAYINPQGFGLLASELENSKHVRLLLGAEPEEPTARRLARGGRADADKLFQEALEKHVAGLTDERDLLGFSKEADTNARRFVAWLRANDADGNRKVEVRRFKDGFVHGKAFIAEDERLPAVLAGSSNFTFAGLAKNYELNLGYPSGTYTYLVQEWFNDLWEHAESYDLAAIYEERWESHLPWVVFLRMLWELYSVSTKQDEQIEPRLNLTGFQRDGVARALRILDELGGVLIADEVGLGKTFIAGEVIYRAIREERQQVLVVTPSSLKNTTWIPFLKQNDLLLSRVEVVTYDQLREGTADEVQDLDRYAVVIIDEAHNLRNPAAQRSKSVKELFGGKYPKKAVLLTATPVNNSLRDLETLIGYFVRNDAQFAHLGIRSIREYIKRAEDMDQESLSPEHLFDLMDQVAVRRTRKFIKEHYQNETIVGPNGESIHIEFPRPEVYPVAYELSPEGDKLLGEVIRALTPDDKYDKLLFEKELIDGEMLTLARYTPSIFSKSGELEQYQISNAGLLRTGLLKRLESSAHALNITLERLIVSHEYFIDALDDGWVLAGDALREWSGYSGDSIDEFLAQIDELKPGQATSVEEFHVDKLRAAVLADVEKLSALKVHTRLVEQAGDPKAAQLVKALEQIANEAARPSRDGVSEGDRRKVIIFSEYSDTVRYLHGVIDRSINECADDSALAAYRGRLPGPVTGETSGFAQKDRASILGQFAPYTAGGISPDGNPLSKDNFDILITTDVLAEGVNLQQAGRIINYDLPWNPMRLVQRHGRIDRIGSKHKVVNIGCFFPAKHLDELLALEKRIQRKLALAAAAVGINKVVPYQSERLAGDVIFEDRDKAILELRDGNATIFEERGASSALSGEEYRQRLMGAVREDWYLDQAKRLPFGSGSGFVSEKVTQAGYVFCIKMGDSYEKPWFRWVGVDKDTWQPLKTPRTAEFGDFESDEWWVAEDALTSLVAADPGDEKMIQNVSDTAYEGAFDAWSIAQAHAWQKWSELTDPAKLGSEIPKAFRVAAELIYENGEFLGIEEQQELIAKFNANWGSRIAANVREIAYDDSLATKERVKRLADLAAIEGLEKPQPPKPLPPLAKEDVRLITWMAVSPKLL